MKKNLLQKKIKISYGVIHIASKNMFLYIKVPLSPLNARGSTLSIVTFTTKHVRNERGTFGVHLKLHF